MPRLYTAPPKHSMLPSYIRDDMPVYRLRDSVFIDDTLFEKGSTLETDLDYVPSMAMFPVNDLALKAYKDMLAYYDLKGESYNLLPLSERRGYMQHMPKLPAFEKEWKKVNQLAKQKGIHLCQAIDQGPSILGKQRTEAPKVRAVDMSSVPMMQMDNNPVVQGNLTKNKTSVSAVQGAA